MLVVLLALVPIAVILILGKVLASLKLLSAEGWIGLERITYFVLFPALIVSKLAVADFSEVDWRLPTALVGAQFALGAISFVGGALLGQGRDRLGVYVQSAVRWNTFFALALALELMGPTGLALVAIAAAVMIPTANILSVVALMQFSGTPVKPMKLLKELAVNPLVLPVPSGSPSISLSCACLKARLRSSIFSPRARSRLAFSRRGRRSKSKAGLRHWPPCLDGRCCV